MALPLTGISVSLVRDTIGAGSNDVGTLFLHPNVNEYGFNHINSNYQKAVWGKTSSQRAALSPSDPNYTPIAGVIPGYSLGYFRGYDHDWVAYLFGGVMTNFTDYHSDMVFNVQVERVPKLMSKPAPIPAVEHMFKVEFARNINQFDLGTATVVNAAFTVTEPSSPFTLSALYPPDYGTNGSLAEGEPFYIKVTHLSSPERRWSGLLDVPFIGSYTTPDSLFTNTLEYRNFRVVGVKKTTSPAATIFTVEADLYADYPSTQSISFTGMMSPTSDYSANNYTLYDNNVQIQPNTTPGTPSFVKNLMFDFSLTTLKDHVSVGNTVYGKITASTGQTYTGSSVVSNQLPIEW